MVKQSSVQALAGAKRESMASFADDTMSSKNWYSIRDMLNCKSWRIITAMSFICLSEIVPFNDVIKKLLKKPLPLIYLQALRQKLADAACEVARSIKYQWRRDGRVFS